MKTQTVNLGKVSITVEKDYYDSAKEYDRLVIVQERGSGFSYISRKPVPVGTLLNNREYWIKLCGIIGEDNTKALDEINTELKRLDEEKLDAEYLELLATKEELENYAKLEDIENLASKDDIANMATKDNIADMATKDDIKDLANKDDLENVALKSDLDNLATKHELELKADIESLKGYATTVDLKEVIDDLKELHENPILLVDPDTLATKLELSKKADLIDLDAKADKTEIITDYRKLTHRPTKLSEFINDILYPHLTNTPDCDRCDTTTEQLILYLQNQITELKQTKLDVDSLPDGENVTDTALIATVKQNTSDILNLANGKVDKDDLKNYATVASLLDYVKTEDLAKYPTNDEVKATYATKTELDNYATLTKLDEYVPLTKLDEYYKASEIDEKLDTKVDKSDLDDYVKTEELDNYAKKEDLEDYAKKEDIPPEQVQADWNETNTESKAYILNKPDIKEPVQSDWNETDDTSLAFIKNKPNIPDIETLMALIEELTTKVDELTTKVAELEAAQEKMVISDTIKELIEMDAHTYSHMDAADRKDNAAYFIN